MRTAIKICRSVHWETHKQMIKGMGFHYNYRQVCDARRVLRKWNRRYDKRVPYIPSENELVEQGEMLVCIFKNLAAKTLGKPSPMFDFGKVEIKVEV